MSKMMLELREVGNNSVLPLPQRIERLENLMRDLVGEMNSLLMLIAKEQENFAKELEDLRKETAQ